MPSTDAYGNPGSVAVGEFVEDEWGNATVKRVVKHYPTFPAWNTANPAPGDGEVYTIADQLFVVRGGRLVQASPLGVAPVSISGTSVAGGGATSQLTGTLPLPTVPWDMDYYVTWSGVGTAGATGGVTPTIRNNANSAIVYGTLPGISFLANQSATWPCVAKVAVNLNTTITLAFWVLISGGTINIGGAAYGIGIPR